MQTLCSIHFKHCVDLEKCKQLEAHWLFSFVIKSPRHKNEICYLNLEEKSLFHLWFRYCVCSQLIYYRIYLLFIYKGNIFTKYKLEIIYLFLIIFGFTGKRKISVYVCLLPYWNNIHDLAWYLSLYYKQIIDLTTIFIFHSFFYIILGHVRLEK